MRDIMPMNFQTKLTVGILAFIVLFSLLAGVLVIQDMNLKITATITEKAKSDLATALQIVDYMFPGSWRVQDGILYKGDTRINDNNQVVDKIRGLTDDTVTVFLGDTRVATNVFRDNRRAVGTQAADYVVDTVLKQGRLYLGEAEVLGTKYQTCYAPIRDNDGQIIGMFYVGVSRQTVDQLRHSFTAGTVLSARIALLFALAATCFIPVDVWSTPLSSRRASRWILGSRRHEENNPPSA